MKKIFGIGKKKGGSDKGSVRSGRSASGYNISPKKDLGKLHKAAFEGDPVKLKNLLKRGDVNQLDKENRTPLHLACTEGMVEAVKLLVNHPQIKLNLCDNEHSSALMKCVQCQQQNCLNILLNKGADVTLSDHNGNTALHIAASIPSKDFVYLLLDYRSDVFAKNKDGLTPLHLACTSGALDIVDILIKDEADVNSTCNDRKTPLMLAAQKGHLEVVQLLLKKGASASMRDKNGWTPEDYATMDGHHPIAHILVEHNKQTQGRVMGLSPLKTKASPAHKQGAMFGGPALNASDDFSNTDPSQTLSKRSKNNDDSWGSDTDDDDILGFDSKPSPAKAAPRLNVKQLLNKSGPDGGGGNISLFMTASAKQELEQKQKEEKLIQKKLEQEQRQEEEQIQEDEDVQPMRERYDSKSMKPGPVSPSKPPLPVSSKHPMPAQRVEKHDSDDWDSSSEEMSVGDEKANIGTPSYNRPNKDVLAQLGLDQDDLHNIYSDSESEISSNNAALPAKKIVSLATKDDDTNSWDDVSDVEDGENGAVGKINALASNNLFANALGMKFDDEESKKDQEDDESSSWNSESEKNTELSPKKNMVQTPDEAPDTYDYVTSPPEVVKEAELRASNSSLHNIDGRSRIPQASGQTSKDADHAMEGSDEDSTDMESESSWEADNRSKLEERRRKKLQEDLKVKMEERTRSARLEYEKIKQEAEQQERKRIAFEEEQERIKEEKRKEEERIKGENEKRIKKEEEDRRRAQERENQIKLLENEEEKQKRDEARKKEVERIKNEHLNRRNEQPSIMSTAKRDENLMEEAFKRAAVASTESDLESSSSEEENIPEVEAEPNKEEDKPSAMPLVAKRNTLNESSSKPTRDLTSKPVTDLDILTETDDEMSMNEDESDFKHSSLFSDSIKLEEEKHHLQMKLTKDEEALNTYRERCNRLHDELKSVKDKERSLLEEKHQWESHKVTLEATNREKTFKLNESEEEVKTFRHKLELESTRLLGLQEQVDMEMAERRQKEIDNRELQTELRHAQHTLTITEKELCDVKQQLQAKEEAGDFIGKVEADRNKLSQSILDESSQDNESEELRENLKEQTRQLSKVSSERNSYKDEADRYKAEMAKLRNESSNNDFAAINEDLNKKVDELNQQLRASEESLHVAAMQSIEYKQRYEDEKMKCENALNDLDMFNAQQRHLKDELDTTKTLLEREQERVRNLEESREKLFDKDSTLHDQLIESEKKTSRLENDLQNEKVLSQQRLDELSTVRNDSFKLQQTISGKDERIYGLQKDVTQKEGEIKALEREKDHFESENVKLRQQSDTIKTQSNTTMTEQQMKMNQTIADMEKERVALETQNIQLTQQTEHLRKEVQRINEDKNRKDEELSRALQDRLEAHKKLAYADALSETSARENDQQRDVNKMLQEQTTKLEVQLSSLQQDASNWRSRATELQSERDRHMKAANDTTRKLDNLNQSFDHTESARSRLDQELKDREMENVSLKVEVESLKNRSSRSEELREASLNAQKIAEEKITILDNQKMMLEEKMKEEVDKIKQLSTEINEYRTKWEGEVKEKSQAVINMSKVESEVAEVKERNNTLHDKLVKATEDRKLYKAKYEKLKKQKFEADTRAERYRLSMLESDQRFAETESECDSKLSDINSAFETTKSHMEVKVRNLQEEVATLRHKLKQSNHDDRDINEDLFKSSAELQRVKRERDAFEEKLRTLQAHVERNYVDRGELEAVRQEERARAQSMVSPTLDQVNNYLKERTCAQDVLDQLRQKNEEQRLRSLQAKVSELNEENIRLRKKQEDSYEQSRIHDAFATKVKAEELENRNKVLQQKLNMSKKSCDDYKQRWIDEKKRSQEMFSVTLGGVHPANMSAIPHAGSYRPNAVMNGTNDIYASTPRKGNDEPILNHFRNKLDLRISQQLGGTNGLDGRASSSGSSNVTPRSNPEYALSDDSNIRHQRMLSNDYLSFLPS